jgi:hypothetical protein
MPSTSSLSLQGDIDGSAVPPFLPACGYRLPTDREDIAAPVIDKGSNCGSINGGKSTLSAFMKSDGAECTALARLCSIYGRSN